MKRAIAVVLVLITGCGSLEYYQTGQQYPPSPPPDPTEAILAAQKAATRPAPPPHVLEVTFPSINRPPVDFVEPMDASEPIDSYEMTDGDGYIE